MDTGVLFFCSIHKVINIHSIPTQIFLCTSTSLWHMLINCSILCFKGSSCPSSMHLFRLQSMKGSNLFIYNVWSCILLHYLIACLSLWLTDLCIKTISSYYGIHQRCIYPSWNSAPCITLKKNQPNIKINKWCL